jgi:hypothetical protein
MDDLKGVNWLAPWEPAQPGFEHELYKEVGPRHILHKQKAMSVARRTDCDDVLFFLPDGPAPLAVVHLTWIGHTDWHPEFPATEFYNSLEEWIENGMKRDHRNEQ